MVKEMKIEVKYSKEQLKSLFSEQIRDFKRIFLGEINGVSFDYIDEDTDVFEAGYEYENLEDVVIYCKSDMSVACGVLIEQFEGKPMFSVVSFGEIVNAEQIIRPPFKNVNELTDNNWGYSGMDGVGQVEDLKDLEKARDILLDFILDQK